MSIIFACFQVWFQNRRAKMRRQLKLQGSPLAARPHAGGDAEEKERSRTSPASHCDGELCDGCPWTEGRWERPGGAPSSEELRSCSIAKLRAKAREHEAEIHGTADHLSGGGDGDGQRRRRRQEQEVDVAHGD